MRLIELVFQAYDGNLIRVEKQEGGFCILRKNCADLFPSVPHAARELKAIVNATTTGRPMQVGDETDNFFREALSFLEIKRHPDRAQA